MSKMRRPRASDPDQPGPVGLQSSPRAPGPFFLEDYFLFFSRQVHDHDRWALARDITNKGEFLAMPSRIVRPCAPGQAVLPDRTSQV